MKLYLSSLILATIIVLGGLFVAPGSVFASTSPAIKPPDTSSDCQKTNRTGLVSPIDGADLPQVGCSKNPLPNILRVVFGIFTSLAVIYVALGAFKYTTSGGSSEAIKSAKNTILYAVLGLILSLSAFVITSIIVNSIG